MSHPACAIYFLESGILILSEGQTADGIRISREPFFLVSPNAPAVALGSVVQLALGAFEPQMKDPGDLRGTTASVLRFARVKSWAALNKAAVSARVTRFASGVRVQLWQPVEGDTLASVSTQEYAEITDDAVSIGRELQSLAQRRDGGSISA